jgi:hypothetical protein
VGRLAVLAGVLYVVSLAVMWMSGRLAETDRATEARKHIWRVIVDPDTGEQTVAEIDVRNPRPPAVEKVAAALTTITDANAPARVRVVLKAWQRNPQAIRYSSWGEGVPMLELLCAPPAWRVRPGGDAFGVSVPADPNVPAVSYPADAEGRSAFAARVYDTILESHRALAPYFRRNAPQVPNPKKRQMDRVPNAIEP